MRDTQNIKLRLGDSLELLKGYPDNSIGAVICDPPYGLDFMGKGWDAPWKETEGGDDDTLQMTGFQKWAVKWLIECHRILIPDGIIKVFGGTRTFHRMAAAMEKAGFEIDGLAAWGYGSGFPKSLNVNKAIDQMAGAKRKKDGRDQGGAGQVAPKINLADLAKKFEGYGTAIKPAWEPFLVGRKRVE